MSAGVTNIMDSAIFKNAPGAFFTVLMFHLTPTPHERTEKHNVIYVKKCETKLFKR